MKRTNALKQLLESLTTTFTDDGTRLPVEFDSNSAIRPDGTILIAPNVRDAIGRDLSGADELRVIVDTLSHEAAHYVYSDLTSKRDFMDEYPAFPGVAGAVVNIMEDVYIDHQRFRANPGLRGVHAFTIDAMMGNHHRRPRIDTLLEENPAGALVEGALQVAFAGYAKGFSELPDDIRKTLAYTRKQARRVRNTHDAVERLKISREVTDRLLSHFPAMDDAELQELLDLLDELPTDVPDNGFPLPEPDAVDEHNKQAKPRTAASEGGAGGLGSSASPGADADGEVEAGTGDGSDEGTPGSEQDTDADPDADHTDGEVEDGTEVDADEDLSADEAAMDEQDGDRSAGEWYDSDPEQYNEASDLDEGRYERLQKEIRESQDGLGQRKKDRDKKIQEALADDRRGGATDRAQTALRANNMDREIEAAFNQIATQDFEFPDEEGASLNMDAIVRHRAGDFTEREWYFYEEVAETGDRAVGVSLDLSGSMQAWKALMALGALAIGTRTIGDELVASAFQTAGTYDNVTTPLIIAPGEDFDWENTRHLFSRGITPTAHGIHDVRNLLKQTSKREKVLIVVTDGEANVAYDGTGDYEEGIRSAREAVETARAEGTTVIGLGISGVSPEAMDRTFGEDGYVLADSDDLTTALLNVYGRQMRTGTVQFR